MIWFTSDTHLCHENIIKYCFRPFNNVEEMNIKIIQNWNKVVQIDDLVFVLGDLILSNDKYEVRSILDYLKGKIILITGDHDRSSTQLYPERFESIHSFFKFHCPEKFNSQDISLFHYCMRVWPKSHYNAWHLFGHSHGRLQSNGKSHDVGVDCNNFTPVSLSEIIKIMKFKEDNFNLIKEKVQNERVLGQVEIEFSW